MAAIRGQYLSVTIDGDEYKSDVTAWSLSPAEAEDDDTTFGETGEGGSINWTLGLTMIQDTGANSLHTFLWENQGATATFVVKTDAAVVSATNPSWTFDAVVSMPSGSAFLGAEASKTSRTRSKTEVEWAVDGPLVKDTTP